MGDKTNLYRRMNRGLGEEDAHEKILHEIMLFLESSSFSLFMHYLDVRKKRMKQK